MVSVCVPCAAALKARASDLLDLVRGWREGLVVTSMATLPEALGLVASAHNMAHK